jgi:aminoglycoside phosphotransferase (APT) family kinase protein
MTIETGRLFPYLAERLPGFDRPDAVTVQQFVGGQSNPTYSLATPAGRYVLRKKPAGDLLPSAHAIEREYAVMQALAGQVPVPRMHLLCEDEDVLGQAFYVMDHVEGRVLPDARMLDAPRAERRALCLELISVLARLHRVDYRSAGLETFGKTGSYVERQLARLSKQYEASRVEENTYMDLVIAWLKDHLPRKDESAIVHGDYRSYNVLYAPSEPRIAAVLDWELATIGHPLADLAFACLPYYMPADDLRGFHGADPAELGIPGETELVEHYCRETGRGELPDWRYFLVFSLFRSAAIRAGVYKRAFDGTAAGADALEKGARYRAAAATAARLIQEGLS